MRRSALLKIAIASYFVTSVLQEIYIKIWAKLGEGFNRSPNKVITLFTLNCIFLGEKILMKSQQNYSMSFFFHYGSEQWIHSCCAHSPLLGATIFSTDVFTIYIIYFCKRSNEYLQNDIFLLIKMLENAVESILTKSVMKATPLPQDVTQAFWPSFPFHVVWFCGIFQKLSCFKTKIKKNTGTEMIFKLLMDKLVNYCLVGKTK